MWQVSPTEASRVVSVNKGQHTAAECLGLQEPREAMAALIATIPALVERLAWATAKLKSLAEVTGVRAHLTAELEELRAVVDKAQERLAKV